MKNKDQGIGFEVCCIRTTNAAGFNRFCDLNLIFHEGCRKLSTQNRCFLRVRNMV